MNKIYIVVPVHNRKALTENCLAYLFRQNYKEMEVIVIDDGSFN